MQQDPQHDADRYRQRLYDLRDGDDRSLTETLDAVLEVGRSYLDVENGHVERVDESEGVHEVVASTGDGDDFFAAGDRLPRATTYCRRTLRSPIPLALSNASEEGWADDPAYEEHGLECYLGARIVVDGAEYGTVCFVSRDARPDAFSPTERSFVELVARTIEQTLERKRFRRELADRERALERYEDKYAALVRTAPDAIFLIEGETGTVVEVNEAATQLVGAAVEDVVGRPMRDFHPSEHRQYFDELLDGFAGGMQTASRYEDGTPFLVRTADGETVPVEISVNAVDLDGTTYYQGIIRDVTERRERERELRVTDRAIEEASVGITISDVTGDGARIVYVNETFSDLTGYAESAVVGGDCRFLCGPDTNDEDLAALLAAIEDEEPFGTELLSYRADGTPFWNEIAVTPVEDETGDVTHYVGFHHDVTVRKRREQVVSVLNRVLRHNLRNGMNVVLGVGETLAADLDGEAAAMAERVVATATDLAELCEDARHLERIVRSSELPSERSLDETFATVRTTLDDAFPAADVRVPDADGTSIVGTEHVDEALAEFGTLLLDESGGEPVVEFDVSTADDHVTVVVFDDGSGIPADERRVLQSGRETQLEHASGIGLWLVQWTIDACGGRIEFHDPDEPGVATIRFRTPSS